MKKWHLLLVFALGCSVQPLDNQHHERNKWTRVGHASGVTLSRIHADVFEEAADKEWDDPEELSEYLLEESRKELPEAYKSMGLSLGLELGDEWDKEEVQEILKEIAKGYREVR